MPKNKRFVWVFLLSLMAVPVSLLAGRDEGVEPARGFFIPKGSAESGRKAFVRLQCTACHRVLGEAGLPAVVAQNPGPVLGKPQAAYSRGWLASTIVSPSHTIAWDSAGLASGSELSRMGDFTETMTVRELIDIVAYLKSVRVLPDAQAAGEPGKTV